MHDYSIKMQDIDDILKKHKLSNDDYESIKKILGREPNIIELGIFSAMWSEHCSYKSSKIYLKDFPTQAQWVLQGPGENAGVIDIGDNLAAVFKMESHNHPSFIEPNAGAATGVGGILRDIFTMGANPIANLNSIRFGNILDLDMKKKHTYLLHGVVEGIGHYGNCMGIPTIGGETSFESCYNGNILVNAFSLGIAKHNEIFYGKASGEGNPIMYVGSKTGRDGLGGAVMSSDSFDSNGKSLRPTVQIGDPFVEKSLLEACLEIFKEDLIIGIQDMGAAGLTSSSFEMASRSGSGMVMWLDKVPMREEGMNPYELMLSESQERMLLCAKKGCENRIREIFSKYELSVEVVGEVRNTGKMELFWYGEKCAELEIKPIVENAPVLNRAISKPKYLEFCRETDLTINDSVLQKNINLLRLDSNICDLDTLNILFQAMLKSIDICDKAWIYEQYDDSIKASTIKGAGMGDASIISLKNYNSKKALAMNVKCNVRYCYLNPRVGAKIAVAQAGRNVALSGATPLAITDCLNFGSPENPEVMWQFKESCEGIKEACSMLETPVVSGNVSLYNQTNDEAIYPTPSIACVGLLDDAQNAISSHFVGQDSYICLLGVDKPKVNFSGSLLQKIIGAKISGAIDDIELDKEMSLWEILKYGVDNKLIMSAKDIGQGGVAMTLAKMAIVGKTSIDVLTRDICEILRDNIRESDECKDIYRDTIELKEVFNSLAVFNETQTQVVCEVGNLQNFQKLYVLAKQKGLTLKLIGKVNENETMSGDNYVKKEVEYDGNINIGDISMTLRGAKSLYYKSFSKVLE